MHIQGRLDGDKANLIAQEHVNSFTTALLNDQKDEPMFQLVQVNLQDNPLKSFLLSLFLSSMRKQVPKEQHDNYLFCSQNFELLREPLGMVNTHVGYVYLIDEEGRIRWASVGYADDGSKELESLRSCTAVLLDRLKQAKPADIEQS